MLKGQLVGSLKERTRYSYQFNWFEQDSYYDPSLIQKYDENLISKELIS